MDERFPPIAPATGRARTADVAVADGHLVGPRRPILGLEIPLP